MKEQTTAVETTNHKIDESVRATLMDAAKQLKSAFIERDDEVEVIMLSLVAQEHAVFLGRAGTGKSEMLRKLATVLGLSNGDYFECNLNKFTTPESFLGPHKYTSIQKDVYERNTKNRLPVAKVAFLDEIFKNGAAINALLPIMCEGIFENGGVMNAVPLRLLVAASNEMPEDDSLHALWDRFLFRRWVTPIKKRANRAELLKRAAGAERRQGAVGDINAQISESDWDTIVADARKVELPTDVNESLCQLIELLENEGITHGDRRWVKVVRALQAKAYLEGDTSIDEEHFCVLKHVLWDERDQIPIIEKLTKASSNPVVVECQTIYEMAMTEAKRLVDSGVSEEMFRSLTVLKTAGEKIRNRRDAVNGKALKRIEVVLDNMRGDFAALKDSLKEKHSEMFGEDL